MRARRMNTVGSEQSRRRPWHQLAVRLSALLASVLVTMAMPAHADVGRALQSADFSAIDGNRVVLTLTLNQPAPEPVVFTIDKPARLSLDLADTRLALAERFRRINVGKIQSYAAAEAKGRTRVVVEMTDLVPYTVRTEGNKITLELSSGAATAAAAAPAATRVGGTAPAPSGNSISNIDFRRGDKGEGRVLVTLSDPKSPVDVREEGGKVIARFRNTSLPEKLARRLDVLDFGTPVKFVDIMRDGINTQIVLTPAQGTDYEQMAYQTGDQFALELQPLTREKAEDRKRAEPTFTGEKISLSFQNVDVRSLLQIIADVAGTNMVVSDSVQGQLAMRLQNVPWDQALDIILRTKGLGMRREGNVMMVAPVEELATREKVELESQKQKVQLAPLRSEIIQVNYAKASDFAALLRSGDNSLLSERGRVTIDERTNTLLVLETREKLADIRALVQRLDIPVRQVLIESRIVIASDNYDRELGARFGVTGAGTANNGNLYTTSGTNTSTNATVTDYLNNSRTGGLAIDGVQSDRYNVNLPVTSAAGALGLAILTKNFLVDMELSALQAEGKGQVTSAPRLITANAKQASIEQGVEIPYQQSTSSGATSVSFKKAVLSLNVTPQITPDERIIMDLAINKDSIGQNVNTGSGGTVPAIDTRKINTQVLVDNGQTVVLGGIYEDTLNRTTTKVPLLGDIPVMGQLFRNTINSDRKTELLIFITPKILSEGLQVRTGG